MILMLNKLKATVVNSKLTPLALLLALVTYAYYPFLSGMNMGADDAHWYQYILHDGLVQLEHGIFPNYLGQSQFNAFGGPTIRAPYYLIFGQILHLFTFFQLSALTIQHLTVFFSAILASLVCYFSFSRLAPQYRWLAFLFSLFYVTCPGVLGLIYYTDAYYSFMTIPFIPLALYGLTRFSLNKKILTYSMTAAALALIWMSHPPHCALVNCPLFSFLWPLVFVIQERPISYPSSAKYDCCPLFMAICWNI